MTTLMSDTFTGSNGTAWSTGNWTSDHTGSGGGATIQSNAGKLASGTAGSYDGNTRTTRTANITAPTDVDITGTWSPDANEPYGMAFARAVLDGTGDPTTGYILYLDTSGTLHVDKAVSSVYTQLGSNITFSASSGNTYGFRLRAVGTSIQARVWSGAEPGTWNVNVTDSSVSGSGKTGLSVRAGNAAVAHAITFDSVIVTDGAAASTPISMSDTGSGTEALSVAAATTLTDTFHGTDALSVRATLTMPDTGSFSDAMHVSQLISGLGETGSLTDSMTVTAYREFHSLKTEVEMTPGVWIDISEYVVGETPSRGMFGRPSRYDDVSASSWTTSLRNGDGRFTSSNPSSPYFPNFAKGKGFRVTLVYAGHQYPRIWGKITDINLPSVTDVSNSVVNITATDVMATLGRKTLSSPFVEESQRQARSRNGGCDVFPFIPSQVATDSTSIQVASTTFENKGVLAPGVNALGTCYVMAASNGAGTVKSSESSQDAILVEGQIEFTIGDDGFGKQAHPVLTCTPQASFQQFEMFFKVPEGALPPIYATGTRTVIAGESWDTMKAAYGLSYDQLRELNPQLPGLTTLAVGQVINIAANSNTSEWVLAHLWAGSTEMFRVVLGNNNGVLVMAIKKPDNSAQLIFSSVTLADDKWRKLTIYRDGSNSVRGNINDSPVGGSVSLSTDLTSCTTVYVGGRVTYGQTGRQVQCPPVALAGISMQSDVTGVWYWYCLGAPPANVTALERLGELSGYAYPISFIYDGDGDLTLNVVRTPTKGRTVLDCMQELARTSIGFLWVDPTTGKLILKRLTGTESSIATITLEEDDDETIPPQWQDTTDVHPTRVTASCPAGTVTSINTAAEAAGMYRDETVSTCAATIAGAQLVADRIIGTGSPLHMTQLTVDMVNTQNALWDKLLSGLEPGAPITVDNLPSALIGISSETLTVESWEESYTIESAQISMATTPVAGTAVIPPPPLADFTVTSTIGTQSGSTVSISKPSGTATGDVLIGIMTVDNTGGLSGMSAPDSSWTKQGSGGTASAGYGNVWTKVAGASEPSSYTFTAVGSSGSQVLTSDAFTGSIGAAFSSSWASGDATSGATATLSGDGWGILDAGTATGYTGRISEKANISNKADVEILLSFKFDQNDTFGQLNLRGPSSADGSSGYELRFDREGTVSMNRIQSFVGTLLGTMSMSFANNTTYKARFQAKGTTIQARVWPASDVEPSSWSISATDSGVTAAGTVSVVCLGGDTAHSKFYVDDVTVSDPNAITSIPEAKLTLTRVSGADTTTPIAVGPTWGQNSSATTSHVAPSVTAPTGGGLLLNHWSIVSTDSGTGGSGGGGGGSADAFNFGMSGVDSASDITNANAWLANHSLRALGHWTDNTVSDQQGADGIGPGGKFASWTGILDVAVGGIFDQAHGGESGGDTWAHAASGTYDSRWTTALNNIKTAWGSRTPGNLHLRFAHEFNGTFSPWAVNNSNTTNFKNAWIRFANLAHSILPGVQLVWSPNDGTDSMTHIDDAYPGSSYVDVIGPDSYNSWPHVSNLSGWTSKINDTDGNGNPTGIEAWRQYAETKGKPLAIPEWGNPAVDTGGGAGGGDAPYFGQAFLSWAMTHGGYNAGQVKYACYFNIGTAGGYAADFLIWASGSNGTVHQPLTAEAIRTGA